MVPINYIINYIDSHKDAFYKGFSCVRKFKLSVERMNIFKVPNSGYDMLQSLLYSQQGYTMDIRQSLAGMVIHVDHYKSTPLLPFCT